MSKRSFLSPVALSATILMGTQLQPALAVGTVSQVEPSADNSRIIDADGFGVVLDRSQGREVQMAYHTSHSSHSSHGSHCSGYSYC